MFKKIVERLQMKKAVQTPYRVKEAVVRKILFNTLKSDTQQVSIPVFLRVDMAFEQIVQMKLLNKFFVHRALIPAFCKERKFL